MKKTLCLVILLCTILSCYTMARASGFSTYTDSFGTTFAQVNNPNPADRLHLRTEPRLDAPSFGKYYNGVTVEVLSYPSADWVKVRIHGTEGYMLKQYLSGAGVAQVSPTVTVNNPNSADRLTLRAAMSETSDSLGKYENGTQVVVLGVGTTWHHVIVDGKVGYMMAKYLTSVDGGTSPENSWLNVNNPNPADRLHLRTQPRTDAPSLGKYYNGVSVEVLSYPSDTWVKVRIGNAEGYMLKKNLTTAYVTSAIPILTVNNPNSADRLNLRAGMSETSASLGKYYNGTKVEVLGISTAWYHVRVDGKVGYMMAKYLTPLAGNAATGSPGNSNPNVGTLPSDVTKNVVITYDPAPKHPYNKADLDAAAASVLTLFETTYLGCELQRLWYDETRSDEELLVYDNTEISPNFIVFLCDFRAVSGNSETGFEQGYTYHEWMIIARRKDSNSPWVANTLGL